MSKTFAIADTHGNFFGFADAISKCGFREDDTLISLGDICDGGFLTKDVIDILLQFPNLVNVQGNHDKWALDWMKYGDEYPLWWNQGGQATAKSYDYDYENVPKEHIKFLENAIPYYVDHKNRVFVHGGFNPLKSIASQSIDVLLWDRDLLCNYAPKYIVEEFDHVFVGHTSTQFLSTLETDPIKKSEIISNPKPATLHNVTGLDTGSGWNGNLTIMNVDTFEYWQSDINAKQQTRIMDTINL